MPKLAALDRHVVDERPVPAVEVGDYELVSLLLNHCVASRDGTIPDPQSCAGLATNQDGPLVHGDDRIF